MLVFTSLLQMVHGIACASFPISTPDGSHFILASDIKIYGKVPIREGERETAAATIWASLSE